MLRKFLRLTQQGFADKLGIKRNTVATYEAGRSKPSDAAVLLICRECNVNEEWLRTGKGEMFNPTPSSELDALAMKYDLSDEAYILIKKFVNLKVEQQNVIIDFIKEVAASLAEEDYSENTFCDSNLTNIDIDKEVESYRQALELQEKVKGKFYASNGQNTTSINKKNA